MIEYHLYELWRGSVPEYDEFKEDQNIMNSRRINTKILQMEIQRRSIPKSHESKENQYHHNVSEFKEDQY